MFILIGLAVLLALGLWLNHKASPYSGWECVGLVAAGLSGICLIVALIGLPLNRMEVRAGLAEFNAVKASRQLANDAPVIEAAAWRMKVAEANAWLASKQFYNTTAFDLWIPDEVDDVEPIR